jgi:hypothetical protein
VLCYSPTTTTMPVFDFIQNSSFGRDLTLFVYYGVVAINNTIKKFVAMDGFASASNDGIIYIHDSTNTIKPMDNAVVALGTQTNPIDSVFTNLLYINSTFSVPSVTTNAINASGSNQSISISPTGTGTVACSGTVTAPNMTVTSQIMTSSVVATSMTANSLSATTANSNLTLSGNGTGFVSVAGAGGMSVTGAIQGGASGQFVGALAAASAAITGAISALSITLTANASCAGVVTNSVTGKTTNSDLTLSGNGTGFVVIGSTGMKLASALTNYIASAFTAYMENNTGVVITFSTSSPSGTSQTVTIRFTLIGNVVSAEFVQFSVTSTNGTGVAAVAPAGSIPSPFRPVSSRCQPIIITNNSATNIGMVGFKADGGLEVYAGNSLATFVVGNNWGIGSGTIGNAVVTYRL